MPVAAKAAWEVRGGILPGTPRPELTERWFYTSIDAEADRETMKAEAAQGLDACRPDAPKTIFQQRKDEAIAYWNELNDPRSHNWAELVWIWY